MQQKKVPMRRCIGCMNSKPKRELIRIVRTVDGSLQVDATGKRNGRGAYICNDPACFEKMVKGHKLSKELDMPITDSVYAELRNFFSQTQQTSGGGAVGQ